MSFKLTLREQRARATLRAWRIESPSSEDWSEALKLVDNALAREAPRASDYIGSYGLAKQDQVPYKPLLSCGAPTGKSLADISGSKKPDELLKWLLNQPNPLRK